MFPYSHMTREELISRAELEGDGLSRALAAQLEDAETERLEAVAEKEAAEKVAEIEENATKEADDRATNAEADLDGYKERADKALALIPPHTKHKGLLAIKAALEE